MRAFLPLLTFVLIFLGSGFYFSSQDLDFAFYQIAAPVAACLATPVFYL